MMCTEQDLTCVYSVYDIDFTYVSDVNGTYSTINHFIISNSLNICVNNYCTVNDIDNMSDHLPLWAPNDTPYKRWSCHSGLRLLCKLCRTSPPPAMGARFTVFLGMPAMRHAGWLALLLTKADDVETNPGPTTLNKKVWICDICHKQIHVRKQISIRCNRIEHWVHLRCASIRQAQYTDTWTAIYTDNPDLHLTHT